MKTIKFIIVASILASLMYACNQKPSEIKEAADNALETMTKQKPPTPKPDTISKDTFDVWKKRWDDDFRNYMANDSLHYFDMPLVDLREILHESPVDKARFYMGMDHKIRPHLMLVGLYKGVPNFDIIADYTEVCPPFCDKK